MKYCFEKLSIDNIKDLVPLYENAFGKPTTVKALIAKFDTGFTGHAFVGFTAYDKETNEAAAFYGVFPCFCIFQNEKLLVAQSGNTMTHSNHRGQGLFTQLALETYNYCKEIGIHLVFGFPNNNSYPGFVKNLDWIHFDDIEAYCVRVRTISFYRLNKWFKMSEKSFYERGDSILSNFVKGKPFQSSCFTENTPVIDRSTAFFNYKTYEKNYLIQLSGLNLWVNFNTDFLVIGDIELATEQEWNNAIRELKKIAAKMFIPHLRFQGSTETRLARYFANLGQKLEVTHAIGGVNFTNKIPLEKMKFTSSDNDTF